MKYLIVNVVILKKKLILFVRVVASSTYFPLSILYLIVLQKGYTSCEYQVFEWVFSRMVRKVIV